MTNEGEGVSPEATETFASPSAVALSTTTVSLGRRSDGRNGIGAIVTPATSLSSSTKPAAVSAWTTLAGLAPMVAARQPPDGTAERICLGPIAMAVRRAMGLGIGGGTRAGPGAIGAAAVGIGAAAGNGTKLLAIATPIRSRPG